MIKDFGGKTPSTMEELLTLPGVGRKTANLVLILAYESRKNICVDTHVHRIANRLGWVQHEDTGRNGAGAVSRDGIAMVALHQSLSRHMGTERVPAGLSAMPGVRDQRLVSAHRRDGRQPDDAGKLSLGSGHRVRIRPVIDTFAGIVSTIGVVPETAENAGDPGRAAGARGRTPAGSSRFSAETLPCPTERHEAWMRRRNGIAAPGCGHEPR